MKSKVFILILIPCSLLAKWEKWEPWITDLGATLYGEIEYRVASPESLRTRVNVEKGGADVKIAAQVCLPPFYLQWGFSNILNVILMPSRLAKDTVLSPLYLNWRGGIQLAYKETFTYHTSVSLIKAIGSGELGFTSGVIENVWATKFPLGPGKIQILGNIGGGITSEVLPLSDEKIREDKSILNFCLGVFWGTSYITPYLYTGMIYAIDAEEMKPQYFLALGVEFVLPWAYLKGIPDIPYPKCYSWMRE